jgi:hypothetical protein
MDLFRLAAFALILIVFPACADAPVRWGAVAEGLKMSIAITGNLGDADAELQINVKNVSDEPILLPLGSILNHRTTVLWFRALVTTPDGNEHTFVPGAATLFRGRFQVSPLTVELVPNASYVIELALTEWNGGSIDQATYLAKPSRLRVELDATNAQCPVGGSPNTIRPCWRGKLVSNLLKLTK